MAEKRIITVVQFIFFIFMMPGLLHYLSLFFEGYEIPIFLWRNLPPLFEGGRAARVHLVNFGLVYNSS